MADIRNAAITTHLSWVGRQSSRKRLGLFPQKICRETFVPILPSLVEREELSEKLRLDRKPHGGLPVFGSKQTGFQSHAEIAAAHTCPRL
jgi:hypothetical protein